ncbi:sugar nucleotide-binding protein [Candidatus Woesebacteria bacterium]|nr:sugar nucleotide-binding protein [Candidatus Woesebacteria bacterium]
MAERPLAIIGGSSFVGASTIEQLKLDREIVVLSPSHKEVDITNKGSVREWILFQRPRSVVLLAAWTDVDGAEKGGNISLVSITNVNGVVNVANAVKEIGAHLIYVSTDFVFSGQDEKGEIGPYSEDCKPPRLWADKGTRGYYGGTKFLGELMLETMGVRNAVVRISYPFGNIVNPQKDYALKMIKAANKYPIFTDQYITPTYIPDFTAAVGVIASRQMQGTYHVATNNLTTPFAFVKRLYTNLGLSTEGLKRGNFKSYGAPRPQYGGLICSKTEGELGIKFHSWQDAVDEYSEEIKRFIPQEELFK